jgi:hypothetical protein
MENEKPRRGRSRPSRSEASRKALAGIDPSLAGKRPSASREGAPGDKLPIGRTRHWPNVRSWGELDTPGLRE